MLQFNPNIHVQLRKLFPPKGSTECWSYFGGTKTKYPVGKVKIFDRWFTVRFSRLICCFRDGDVPNDHEVAHLCQNRNCGNPSHLVAWPRDLHARADAHFRATKKAVEAAGCKFTPVTGRLNFADAEPLDDESNWEIAQDLSRKLCIPLGLAKELVQNDADLPALVAQNRSQFPKLQTLWGNDTA